MRPDWKFKLFVIVPIIMAPPVSIYEGVENDHPGPSDSALCVIDRGVVAARPGAICRIIINEDSLMPNSFECFNGDPRCK